MRYLTTLLLPPLLTLGAMPGEVLSGPLPEPAGQVTTLAGAVWLRGPVQESEAHLGQAVIPGMLIRTGPAGRIGVMLSDGTRIGIGPYSELSLDEYRFDPARGEFRMAANLARGTMSLTAGSIGRLDPRGIRLNTPDGQVRVRDAHALLKVGP